MTTVLRASTNTTAPVAYDSTKLDAKHFMLAGRHFARFKVIHNLYSRGFATVRTSANT